MLKISRGRERMIKKITGMRKKCMAILLAIIISISTLPLETLQIFPTIINYLKSEVNEIYALSIVDASSSGIFVGTFDAYGFDGNAYTIDGVNYEVSEDYDDVQIANTLDYFLISENEKKDTRVVYRLSEGKLQQMVPISYVIRPAITLQVEKKSSNSEQTFVYLNGEFTRESVPMNVTLEVVYEPNSIFSKEEIQNLTNLSIPVKEMKLFFRPNEDDQDKLNFGKTSFLKREITEVNEEEITLMYGEKEYYAYDIYVQEDYVPQAVDEKESVACLITSANGAKYYGWDVDIHIGNIDIQHDNITKIKAGSSEREALNTIEEELSGETSIGLDANLYKYFSAEQIEEMEAFLTVYSSLMINADKLEEKNIFQDRAEKIKKEIKSKIYSELGLTSSVIPMGNCCKSDVKIEGESSSGEKYVITFFIKLDIYSFDSLASGYASSGEIHYVMTKPDNENEIIEKGIAAVTYVDLEAFANLVLDYVKIAYDKAWGKNADKVASMFVSKPIAKLLEGQYSDKSYKLLKKATTSSVKTMAATTSTDTKTTAYPLKKISVSSPVDVYIYNSDETLCGSIIDDKIDTNTGEVFFFINGDERYVYTTGEDYYIQFVGNGQNTMTYEIVEYEDGTSIRTVTSKDVEIGDGQVYTAYIPEDLGTKCSMYELEDDEGNTIGIDSDTDASDIGECGDNVRYRLSKDGILTIYGEGSMWSENLPWAPATLSSDNYSIKMINIGYGITDIPSSAFYNCRRVSSIAIPDGVENIGKEAFHRCDSLKRIVIPKSVKKIEEGTFSGCNNLTEINFVEESEIEYIGSKAFDDTAWFDDQSENYDGALYIGKCLYRYFGDTKEEFFTVKDGTVTICYRAMENQESLKEITFPNSLEYIGEYAFYKAGKENSISMIDFSETNLKAIEDYAFEFGSINDIRFNDGLESIGSYAFAGYGYGIVALPNSVKTLGSYAFLNWNSAITYGIGKECIYSIYIPPSVVEIDSRVVGDPSGAHIYCERGSYAETYAKEEGYNYYYPDSEYPYFVVDDSGTYLQDMILSDTEVYIPEKIISCNRLAFGEAGQACSLDKVINWSNVEKLTLNQDAHLDMDFSALKGLKQLTLGSKITEISDSFLSQFDSLLELRIQEGNTSVVQEDNLILSSDETKLIFCNDNSGVVTIPDTVTSVECKAFNNKGAIKVKVPETVTYIDNTAFDGCTPIICGEKYSYAYNFALSHNFEFCYLGLDDTGECGDNLTWLVDERGTLRITGTGDMNDYNPYGGDAPPWGKYYDYIEKIEIESGVTGIGSYAFYYLPLVEDVEIADSVTAIADYAFNNCSDLCQITIPQSVSHIGREIFRFCDQLKEINVADNNNSFSSKDGVLFDKKQETLIKYPSAREKTQYDIPETVYHISEAAFEGCYNLEKLTIPSNAKDIGADAIDGCVNLTSIGPLGGDYSIEYGWKNKIPDNLFSWCYNLQKVVISEDIKEIGSNAFNGCKNITDLYLSEGLEKIGGSSFAYCEELNNVIIPKSVTNIDAWAFSGCDNLKNIAIPENVIDIGYGAFGNCTSLTEINVDSENNNYCSVDGVLFNKNKTVILCYPSNREGTTYEVPDTVIEIYEGAFCYNNNLKEVVIPESVTTIKYLVFEGAVNLEKVIIPENVINMEYSIFSNCDKVSIYGYKNSVAESYALENNIPFVALDNNSEEVPGESTSNTDNTNTSNSEQSGTSSVKRQETSEPSVSKKNTEIGELVEDKKSKAVYKVTENTFDQLTVTYVRPISKKIGAIKIPDNVSINGENYKVVSVATNAFSGCKKLKSVTIGKNVTAIGNNAFKNCTSLKKVIIPARVTSIGKNAFAGCKKLKNVIVKTKVLKKIGKNAFKGINKAARLKVPKKQLKKYQKLFKKAKLSKGITITK